MASETHRALILTSTSTPASVENVPKPRATPGSAVVRIIVANVLPYARAIYSGNRDAPFPTPLVIGSTAIGRVDSVGPDASCLSQGQLVWVGCMIRARDDPNNSILFGYRTGPTEAGKKLIEGEWRDATYATYAKFAKVPLENCYILNERRLMSSPTDGGLGYSYDDLSFLSIHFLAYGGLRDLNVQAGETIIVAPATGSFGGAAVRVALALGARVIAAGRNLDKLKSIAEISDMVEIVQLKGDDVQADALKLMSFGVVDAFLDFSLPEAGNSTHIESCLTVLKIKGRAALMGGVRGRVSIPYFLIMFKSLQLRGNFMCERDHAWGLIKLCEQGLLKLGSSAMHSILGKYPLEEYEKAFEVAGKTPGYGAQVLLAP
ncbi:MAG: hypothetical protein LQ342_000943 [Letrouitia transgressa]|nr:MAG: hypothetical protein LQ342_000943 [Letrouitia transgressa]